MSMRFDTMLFPGGLSKAFTLSYDDGVTQDQRLAELFRSHGLKCTFNLNAGMCGHKFSEGVIRMQEEEFDEVYQGHETAATPCITPPWTPWANQGWHTRSSRTSGGWRSTPKSPCACSPIPSGPSRKSSRP